MQNKVSKRHVILLYTVQPLTQSCNPVLFTNFWYPNYKRFDCDYLLDFVIILFIVTLFIFIVLTFVFLLL